VKPHIFRRGKFWWARGWWSKIGRDIVVHGTSAVAAGKKFEWFIKTRNGELV
jgi:hypothetical protein